MRIITVTLNPAFDLHLSADGFLPYGESVARVASRDAGGKGINISRALSALGVESEAVVLVGEENGEEYLKRLENEQIRYTGISLPGRIRENITLHTKGKPETRISFEGFRADKAVLAGVRDTVCGMLEPDSIVAFAGSLPRGMSNTDAARLLLDIKSCGARLVLDSKSLTRDELLTLSPWLIKPNEDEVAAYIGGDVRCLDDAVSGAVKLRDAGIDNVMITLGARGAILATDSGTYIAKPPSVQAVSTVGAGDSTVAGFVSASLKETDGASRIAMAVATGTSACLTEGTRPPELSTVNALLGEISVEQIN